MGGGGRSGYRSDGSSAASDQGSDEGIPSSPVDNLLGGEQTMHNFWRGPNDIARQLGVSKEEAQDMYDAVNGFSRGWDSAMRARQNGASAEEILNIGRTRRVVQREFGGDVDAYMSELDKKVASADRFLELSPKWNGGDLHRGYSLSQADVDKLTSGNLVDLNFGNASWTTSESTASKYAADKIKDSQPVRFIAHTSGQKRNATSIKNLAYYTSEDEVYASKGEAFACIRTQKIGSEVHAWYDVVDYNHKWKR